MISFGVHLNERIFPQPRNRLDCYGATESALTVLLLFLGSRQIPNMECHSCRHLGVFLFFSHCHKGWRGSRHGSRVQILEIRIDHQYTHFRASGSRNAWAHLFTQLVVLGGDKQPSCRYLRRRTRNVLFISKGLNVSIRLLSEAPSSMGMTPKVNHSRFDFNLMFLTLGIFTTEGTKKKNNNDNNNNHKN